MREELQPSEAPAEGEAGAGTAKKHGGFTGTLEHIINNPLNMAFHCIKYWYRQFFTGIHQRQLRASHDNGFSTFFRAQQTQLLVFQDY